MQADCRVQAVCRRLERMEPSTSGLNSRKPALEILSRPGDQISAGVFYGRYKPYEYWGKALVRYTGKRPELYRRARRNLRGRSNCPFKGAVESETGFVL